MPTECRARGISGRRIAWILAAAICVASLVLSAYSAINYTEIAKAKILSYVETEESVALRFDADGSLESVNLTLSFRVVNPSGRELRTWILAYKGWVRDRPMEEGTDTSRWMVDGRLYDNGTEKRFYPVFAASYSFDSPQVIVPARSNITVIRWIEVAGDSYPDILSNVADILNGTAAGGNALEWLNYTSAILFVQDIAQFAGPNGDASLIRRFDGIDITPSAGGAGP